MWATILICVVAVACLLAGIVIGVGLMCALRLASDNG